MIPGQQTQQRKTHLIKKEFQYKFILKFCLIILAGVIVSTSLLFAFSQDTLTSSFNQSRLVIRSTGYAILPAVVYTNLAVGNLTCTGNTELDEYFNRVYGTENCQAQ